MACDDRQKAVKAVMAEFARICTLQLTGSSVAICDLFKSVSAPAAMLESIRLSDRNSYYGDTGIVVPLVLPADEVPRLRNLEINGFPVSWDNPWFTPTLTTLLLHGRSGVETWSLTGSFEVFLSALERMPILQELALEHVIPPAPSGPPSRKVPLMRLSSLRVVAGDAECRSVLNHLTLPSDVRFHITVAKGPLGRANLFLTLQTHFSSTSPLRTASFDDSPSGLSLKGWRAELQQTALLETPIPRPDLKVEVVTGHSIPALLRASTIFTGVTHLDIRLDGPVHSWRWKDAFAGMPNVRCIYVCKDQDTGFLDALCHTTGDDPTTLALPHLELLKLSDMCLATRNHDEPPEFFEVMVDSLIKRCNCGFPLQELHIEECFNIYQEDVDQLVDIVPELHWDSVEQEECTTEEEEEDDYGYGYGLDPDDGEFDDYDVDEDDLMFDGGLCFGMY
ncbi:hypothetical protein OH76DRAFT_375331 [Lentinus brumalis]|uniref:F-box domain-containing protein n=1 Tax=Lentinus brumalis TaxID=2498619 RepID=A0A371DEJ3_9APHY|nr:hypothetical protein OH76DRAFT_375331 [Polyporus brumalis]